MAYTPVEVRHVQLRRGLLGYRRGAVDRAFDEIAESFELVWRERGELADQVERLEGDLERHRDLEALLRTTLVSAEKAAHDLKTHAQREAQLILDEARAEARAITRAAETECARLQADARRVQALLAAALDAVGDAVDEAAEPAEAEAA
jgi:cell division initiation protein